MWVFNLVTHGIEFDSPRLFANNIFVATNNYQFSILVLSQVRKRSTLGLINHLYILFSDVHVVPMCTAIRAEKHTKLTKAIAWC